MKRIPGIQEHGSTRNNVPCFTVEDKTSPEGIFSHIDELKKVGSIQIFFFTSALSCDGAATGGGETAWQGGRGGIQ